MIGTCKTTVGELFGAEKQTSCFDLKHKNKKRG